MKKRILSMVLVLVMLFSMISGTVFAIGTGSGSGTSESPWKIGDMVANDGVAEPQGVTVEGSYWVRTADIPAAETLVCQLEEHAHETGGCEMASVSSNDYACGMEPHVHSVEAGCITTTEAYTLWTLTAETVSEEESSVAEVSDESAETEESVVTEEAVENEEIEGAEAPEADMAAADTTYTVIITAKNGNSSLRYVEIVIADADGETVDYVDTDKNGRATYDLSAGTYTAIISYTEGSYSYYAEETFTVSDRNLNVALGVTQSYSSDAAQNTYNRTSYFNHVDIRVKGTYTTGTNIDLTTYNIHLANVSIVVDNPGGNQDYTQRFTNNNESYEWRWTSVKVYKGAAVHLTCDIYDSTTNTILKSGFTYTFYDGTHNGVNYGSAEFVKAIQQCDIHQGLDFIISPSEIIEAVFYDVSYDWDVVDAQGNYVSELPDGLATLPATIGGYKSGDAHNIDTHHQEGHYVVDETNGKLYTFQGWDWWSHDFNNLKANVLGATFALTVTDDTVIYGVWTVSDLALAESHITITKKFVDKDGASMEAPAGYHMLLVGPQGGSLEIPLAQFTCDEATNVYSYELPVYTEGTYTIAEHEYEIEGYTMAPSVTVSESVTAIGAGHNHVTVGEGTISADSAAFTLDLDYVSRTACAHVGKVDFVNTYTKKTGNPVHNYPNLAVNKLDADDRSVLQGATFVLYKNYDAGAKQFSNAVSEGISDESGYLYFRNLQPGIYYLKETTAPEDYLAGYDIYCVNVTLKAGFPTEILYEGAWCEYYEYDMRVEYSLDDGVSWAASQHFSLGTTGNRFRLAAFNEKVNGKLIITKAVVDPQNYYDGAEYSFILDCNVDSFDQTFTLKAGESKTIDDIPWGTTYTLTEDTTEAGFTNAISDEGNGKIWAATTNIVVTNTYEYVAHNEPLTLSKVDKDDTSVVIEGAGFTLYTDADCTTRVGREVFSDANGKVELAIDAAGTYYLKETTAPVGYYLSDTIYTVTARQEYVIKDAGTSDAVTEIQMIITIEELNGVSINNIDYTYEIANRAIKPVVVNVTKVWEDGGYHARPENVTITLFRDDTAYDTQVLNEANNWYYSWTGLTDEHEWSVDEVEVPAGYTKEIKADGYKFTITNTAPVVPSTPEPEPQPAPQVVNEDVDYIDVSVNKIWVGKGVKHPDAVFVVLYGNGIGHELVEMNAANNWTYTWKGLPDNVTWRVDEISVPEGYHKKVEQKGNHFSVSNIHKDVPVTGDDSALLGLSIMLATAMAGLGLAGCLMVVSGKRKKKMSIK